MKKILIFCSLSLFAFACSKPKNGNNPTLTVKSFNTDIVPQNSTLLATLNFTQNAGGLDSVYVLRTRLNVRGPQYQNIPYGVPKFDGQGSGEISIYLDYNYGLTFNLPAIRVPGTGQNQPDTLQLKFVVKDAKGNFSDSTTAVKNVIVLR